MLRERKGRWYVYKLGGFER
ncbi:MAG: hypothetical protein RRA45_03895 [Saccharolobus sp.]|nr:hypothetical protein [Saccharolobus sp.]MDT7861338.1 hypothetical protein [Saccharolobus sp.]